MAKTLPHREVEVRATTEKYLLFRLQNALFGLPILEVSEILGTIQITPLPQSPLYIAGMMTVRGEPIAVMDLRRRLQLEAKPYDSLTRIIFLKERQGERLGLLVDAVKEIARIDLESISEPGELIHKVGIGKDYLRGVAILNEEPVFILNCDYLLEGETGMTQQKVAA